MTPKQTALLRVTKLIAYVIACYAGLVVAFNVFSTNEILAGLGGIFIVYLLKLEYDFELHKAEALERLNEVSKK
jgi:hypothetical protein